MPVIHSNVFHDGEMLLKFELGCDGKYQSPKQSLKQKYKLHTYESMYIVYEGLVMTDDLIEKMIPQGKYC